MKAKVLVDYVKKAQAEGWGYVLGGQGEVYSKALATKWGNIRQGGKGPDYFSVDCARWYGHKVVDCSGLIIEAFRSVMPYYEDQASGTLYTRCTQRGSIATLPELPGLCVWRSGHIGVYVGGGKVIEAKGTAYGVVMTDVKKEPWTNWGRLRDIEYGADVSGGVVQVSRLLKYTSPMMRGDDVRYVQARIRAAGFTCGAVDGVFGKNTRSCVVAFQRANRLVQDGVVGVKTLGAIALVVG